MDRTLCCSLNVLILRIHICLNILYICMCMYIYISIYFFSDFPWLICLFSFCLFCGSFLTFSFVLSLVDNFNLLCFVRLDNIFGPQSNVLPCFLCVFAHDYVIDFILVFLLFFGIFIIGFY